MSIIRPPNRFVGLHAHSGFSTMDGLGYPAQHVEWIVKNGMDAWALTDHGNGSGLAHAQSAAKKMKKAGQKFRQLNALNEQMRKVKYRYGAMANNKDCSFRLG